MGNSPTVVGRECHNINHIRADGRIGRRDLHLINEKVYYSDGTVKKEIRKIYDYQRPFWVTKRSHQNHVQSKEREHEDNVTEFQASQSELLNCVKKALGKQWVKGGLRQLSNSPFLYGSDIPSTVIMKQAYRDKYHETKETPVDVAMFDIETDVVTGSEEIIIMSIAMGNKVWVGALEPFLKIKDGSNPFDKLKLSEKKYLQDHIDKGLEVDYHLYKDELTLITECFKELHQWKPALVAVWKLSFDVPKVVERLEKLRVDPKDVFCEPSLERKYKSFWWKEGAMIEIDSNGDSTSVPFHRRWHTVNAPASFYWIDAMVVYSVIRLGGGLLPSYSLDAILKSEIGMGKLKFSGADGYVKLDWHLKMQKEYPIEYVTYNVFDTFGMVLLDRQTKDLSMKVPSLCGNSEYKHFKTPSVKTDQSLYFYLRELGYVPGTVPGDNDESLDKGLGLKGWINKATVPAYINLLC